MGWDFFGYNIYALGLPLVAFFAILQMFSWSIGLAMSGMIMRVGQSAESFAWAAVFILMPVSGVYYPVTVLPHWMQAIAWGLPPAYVFEGMRAILAEDMGVNIAQVSVKATTTERLGFTGREEGLAAQATATVLLPG